MRRSLALKRASGGENACNDAAANSTAVSNVVARRRLVELHPEPRHKKIKKAEAKARQGLANIDLFLGRIGEGPAWVGIDLSPRSKGFAVSYQAVNTRDPRKLAEGGR